jgi:hypothetical protein
MRYDENTLEPCFSFEPIRSSGIPSSRLSTSLRIRRLFWAIDFNQAREHLSRIGATPPTEWIELAELRKIPVSWRDWIGGYFLDIERSSLSNNEFEDRIVDLLKALGFDVTQKGHTLRGEYPDGIFSFEGYAVVYDCKNISNFSPSADDIRAIKGYLKR